MTSAPLPSADPEEAGFIPDRLAQIGPAMQQFVDDGKVPNLVTLVARHGKIVHYDARGYLDIESRRPVGTDTLFRLWSNSKPIAGLATMILFEDGLLTPDDPISKFIPAFKRQRVTVPGQMGVFEPAQREITIRDCLRNTSGIPGAGGVPLTIRAQYPEIIEQVGWNAAFDGSAGAPTARERVDLLARLPLNFQPGSAYEYHASYLTLGVALEVASGMSLGKLYRERIFGPLGMSDTSFYVNPAKIERLPDCYRPDRHGDEWKLTPTVRAATDPKLSQPHVFFPAGGDAGGIVSTIGDYARFAQMLLNAGELDGVRIVGRKTVEYMTSDHSEGMIIPQRGPGFGWGLGVVTHHGKTGLPQVRSVGSYGWSGAAGTQWSNDPKEGLVLLCFTQLMNRQLMPNNTYWEEFERRVYQSLA